MASEVINRAGRKLKDGFYPSFNLLFGSDENRLCAFGGFWQGWSERQ